MLKNVVNRLLIIALCTAVSVPALAGPEDPPGNLAMMGDVLVARPIGLVLTTLGAAAFVVSLPFTAAAGGVARAGETLVVGPAKETFYRCLGCKTSGRHKTIE
jgi:hypothetical protein